MPKQSKQAVAELEQTAQTTQAAQGQPDIATLAATLVQSMIEKGALPPGADINKALEEVATSLTRIQGLTAEAPAAAAEAPARPKREIRLASETGQQPAVPIRESITTDKEWIICLEDGKKMKMLKRHLRTMYDMTPEEYRAKWGLPPQYPMVAPRYAKLKSLYANKTGLGTHAMRAQTKKKKAVATA